MNENKLIEFRIASEDWEFEQIHQLNYRTFVDEIPQHEQNKSGRLVDKFHEFNTYIICVRGNKVLGMTAICDKRPFSLESKVDNLFDKLPEHKSVCEIRLLSVDKEYRNTLVFSGLSKEIMALCLSRNYDMAIISGTVRQLRLYKHMGFIPFGDPVGLDKARYQPMYIDIKAAHKLIEQSQIFKDFTPVKKLLQKERAPVNYMPGPVEIKDEILAVYSDKPESHRSIEFMAEFNELRKTLCHRLKAQNVQLMGGAGTLANDVVATHLRALEGKGLLLVNGEFSRRLVGQATGMGLDFDILEADEGYAVGLDSLEQYLQAMTETSWLWTVVCETSTGVLNDMPKLAALAKKYDIKLCVDGISAIGSMPIDLSDVYLATAVSGKGIGSLPGVAIVFHQNNLARAKDYIPRYFDLAHYAACDGIPFTISTNAIHALRQAVNGNNWDEDYVTLQSWTEELESELEKIGLKLFAKENQAQHVFTIEIPSDVKSVAVGDYLRENGYLLSYKSEYLVKRNWVQICFMGDFSKPDKDFFQRMKEVIGKEVTTSIGS